MRVRAPSGVPVLRCCSSVGLERRSTKPEVAGSSPASSARSVGVSPSGLRHGTLTPASLVQIQPPLPRRRGPLVGQRIVYPPYEGSIPFVGASFNTANAVHSGSSVGRVAVSKTVGRGFESLPLCTVFSEFQVARPPLAQSGWTGPMPAGR